LKTRPREYKSDFARRYYGEGKAEGRAEGKAEGKAEGRAEGKAEGKAEGEAKAILAVLAARGIPVPEEARLRIVECTDLERLEAWVPRAVIAESVDELFDEA
jgi:predicted transposase YdaD